MGRLKKHSKAPTRLPRARSQIPSGLPDAAESREKAKESQDQLKGARVCKKCGQEGRVISDGIGVRVFCNRCKIHWPISGPRAQPTRDVLPDRGLSKHTLVPVDTSIAYEDDEEEWEYGKDPRR